jgi:hypothetical protein
LGPAPVVAVVNAAKEEDVRYLLLIYDEESAGTQTVPPPSEEDVSKVMGDYNAFTKELRDRGVYEGGEALQPVASASTVRLRDGQTLITDGPFMETKEALGGFYLLNCRDLDEALEFAAKCPGAQVGSIEIRPIWEVPSGSGEGAEEYSAAR